MASAYLTRTNGTSTEQKIFTFSAWVKRSAISTSGDKVLMAEYTDSNNRMKLQFKDDDFFEVYQVDGGNIRTQVKTNRKFRDSNGWYHMLIVGDNTQGTNTNRLKIYVNGVQETVFTNSSYPAEDLQMYYNLSGENQKIGSDTDNSNYFDGSMSHINYIDGTAYDASAFGETDTTTGEWIGKTSPSVTYGTNGFFILKDGNGITDQSGEGNDFTLGGGTLTNLKDNPDNVFATLNPLARRLTSNDPTYLNGNTTLQGQTVNGQNNNGLATLGDLAKGKYYFECKIQTIGDNCGVGIVDTPDPSNGIPEGSHEIFYSNDGNKWNGSGYVSYGATYTTGDIIGCAFDVTSGTVEFYKNGVSQGTAATDLATNLNYGYTPMGYTNKGVMNFNFGNGYFGTTAVTSAQNPTDGIGIFEYTPPTNYRAVCTKSINAQEYS